MRTFLNNQAINEAYNNYLNYFIGYEDVPVKEVFFLECRKNKVFSERWGLKIEERLLSLNEKLDFVTIEDRVIVFSYCENFSDNLEKQFKEIMKKTPFKIIYLTCNGAKSSIYEYENEAEKRKDLVTETTKNIMTEISQKFKVGDRAYKPKGYKFPCTIVSIFNTTSGEVRIVGEMVDNGMLHIFSESQLEKDESPNLTRQDLMYFEEKKNLASESLIDAIKTEAAEEVINRRFENLMKNVKQLRTVEDLLVVQTISSNQRLQEKLTGLGKAISAQKDKNEE